MDKSLFEPSPSPTDPEPRAHVFGLFAEQPDVPEFSGNLQALIDASKQSLKDSQSALDGWRTLELEYKNPYPAGAIDHARQLSEPSHVARRPLDEVVLLHRFDFNRAKSFWPKAKSRHQAILLESRKSAQIMKSIKSRLDPESGGLPKPAKKQLEGLQSQLKAKFWVCRTIIEIVRDMEKLSTDSANKLQDAWNNNPSEMSTNDLVQLCLELGAWRDEAQNILRDHYNLNLFSWRDKGYQKFEPKPTNILYMFGTPGSALVGEVAYSELFRPLTFRVIPPYSIPN